MRIAHQILAAVALLLIGQCTYAAATAEAGSTTVTVLEVGGAVQPALRVLDNVRNGQELDLPSLDSRVVLLHYRSATETVLRGPGKFRVNADGVNRLQGGGALTALPIPNEGAPHEKASKVIAGTVLRAVDEILVQSAGQSTVRSAPLWSQHCTNLLCGVMLAWPAHLGTGPWQLTVTDANGATVLGQSVAPEPQQWIPASPEHPGPWNWTLRWSDWKGESLWRQGTMILPDRALLAEAAARQPGETESDAARSLYVDWLRNKGLPPASQPLP